MRKQGENEGSNAPRISKPEDELSCQGIDRIFSAIGQLLPFAEARVEARFLEEGSLPPFRGATIRGGLGFQLKATVCHIKAHKCSDCIVRSSCAYSYIFEGIPPEGRDFMRSYPYIPQPFTILTSLKDAGTIREGDTLTFGFRLFGKAIEHFPYMAYSLIELGRHGLGKGRIKFDVEQITQPSQKEPVFCKDSNRLAALKKECVSTGSNDSAVSKVEIEFLTPARLRVGGKEAQSLTFADIMKAAVRRLSILTHFYGTPLIQVAGTSELVAGIENVQIDRDKTRWHEFTRYSGRQDQKITLGGLVGKMCFTGALARYLPVLKLIEIANIGKATSFGFGRVKVSYT